MKPVMGFILAMISFSLFSQTAEFDRFFLDETMRIDYFHTGSAREESVTLDQVYRYPGWAGPIRCTVDDRKVGRYLLKIFDKESEALIFSRGFDSLFMEYKSTAPALKGKKRTFHESVLIPYPKKPIRLTLEMNNGRNIWSSIWEESIDPADIYIVPGKISTSIKTYNLHQSGPPHSCLDIAIIGEGYRLQDEEKVKHDFQRFAGIVLSAEPYRSLKDKLNIRGVFPPSPGKGCREPAHGSFPQTALSVTFDFFGLDRYIMTEENRAMRDTAAAVPYDTLLVMVNQSRYGGGGIYNLYATFTADNAWCEYLLLHEFGHSFSCLADEYYTSSVTYSDFYPLGVEPAEPNITALLEPGKVKWQSLVDKKTPLPTPWEKEAFDQIDGDYQKLRAEKNEALARMKQENRPAGEIAAAEKESERLSREHGKKIDALLSRNKMFGKVGAFEGAGYASKGLYRPELNCMMFYRGTMAYCRVCRQAVERMILSYCE